MKADFSLDSLLREPSVDASEFDLRSGDQVG
jgi:hypothetical protein